MKVTLRWAVTKRCPFKDEMDAGELVITISGRAPELHKFAADVDEIAAEPISHEDYTEQVAWLLPEGSEVVTKWHTGPWQVEVQVIRTVMGGTAAA